MRRAPTALITARIGMACTTALPILTCRASSARFVAMTSKPAASLGKAGQAMIRSYKSAQRVNCLRAAGLSAW